MQEKLTFPASAAVNAIMTRRLNNALLKQNNQSLLSPRETVLRQKSTQSHTPKIIVYGTRYIKLSGGVKFKATQTNFGH